MTLYAEEIAPQLAEDVLSVLSDQEPFIPTMVLVDRLVSHYPHRWAAGGYWGRELTPQRLGRVMARIHDVYTTKDHQDRRGYRTADLRSIR